MIPALPTLIQGGMGVSISNWKLARAVARAGQLGVVSGVALDVMLARRLQRGDPEGHIRRAMAAFPVPAVVQRVLDRYFVPGGIEPEQPYRPTPTIGLKSSAAAAELAVLGNFVEVYLAKEGHDGVVGLNLLEKMQVTTPTAAYGAVLAGVDFVLMGAGIPSEIPGMLDLLAESKPAQISVHVEGAVGGERHTVGVDPLAVLGRRLRNLTRPKFLAIVSTHVLAAYLARDPLTRPDGFVMEGPVAGGHSAPPRGQMHLDECGDPIYGPRDALDLVKAGAIGLPFWLAGGYGTPQRVAEARAGGAQGVQVGSAFALCADSGMAPHLREQLLAQAIDGSLVVRNHPKASPTNFPFKIAQVEGTLAAENVYDDRQRICDLSYLRTPFRRADGSIGYRCPAEPVEVFVRKGGSLDDTGERRCLCNGLVATTGHGQRRAGGVVEPPLLTLGQDLEFLPELLARAGKGFNAADVVAYLLDEPAAGAAR